MSSENAKKVALDVIDAVIKGKRACKEEITQKNGYTKQSARAQKAVRTKTYKETIRPFLERLTEHRDKVIMAMEKKNLNKEQYKILTDSLNKINHDIQLLGGKETENIKVYGWGNYSNLPTETLDKDIP